VKICMISNLYPPYVHGGAELYVHNIAQRLSAKHDISVITTAPFGSRSSVSNPEVEGKETIYRFYPLNIFSIYLGSTSLLVGLLSTTITIPSVDLTPNEVVPLFTASLAYST